MDVAHDKNSKTCTINIDEEFSIQQIAEVRSLMLEAFNFAHHIIVNMENVTHADITCLQILCSAHRKALLEEKDFTCSPRIRESFKNEIKNAGFLRHKGCALDKENACLWKEGSYGSDK